MPATCPDVDLGMGDEHKSQGEKPRSKKRASKSATKAHQPVGIRPAAKKIGESDDNLKKRGEWFRRRTTWDKDHG